MSLDVIKKSFTELRASVLILVCTVLLIACGGRKPPRMWGTYYSPDNKFSIMIPARYDTLKRLRKTQFGERWAHSFKWPGTVPVQAGGTADTSIKEIEVAYTDIPVQAGRNDAELLKADADNEIDSLGSRLIRYVVPVRDTDLPGCKCKYFTAEIEAGNTTSNIVFFRNCISRDRLYDLRLVAYKGHFSQAEVDSFFASFHVMN